MRRKERIKRRVLTVVLLLATLLAGAIVAHAETIKMYCVECAEEVVCTTSETATRTRGCQADVIATMHWWQQDMSVDRSDDIKPVYGHPDKQPRALFSVHQ